MERKFRGSFEYFNIYENIEYCLFLTLIRFFLFRLFKLLEFKWIAEDFYIFEVGERKGGEVWIFHRVKYCFTINSTRFQYLWEYRLSFSHFLNWYDFSIFVYLNFSNFNESRTNLYFRKSRNERNNSREEVFQYLWEYRLSFFHFDTILLFRLFKLLEYFRKSRNERKGEEVWIFVVNICGNRSSRIFLSPLIRFFHFVYLNFSNLNGWDKELICNAWKHASRRTTSNLIINFSSMLNIRWNAR